MKDNTLKIAALLLILACTENLRAQLSGSYSVPGSFPTLAAAISSLNSVGISGPVTVNIAAAYTETVPVGGFTLFTVSGASATNSLVFQKSGPGPNPTLVAYAGGTLTANNSISDAIWSFVGVDHTTITGIDLYDPNTTNPATMEYGYVFYRANASNGCQYNTIQNCTVTLNRINGVGSSPGGPSFPGSKAIAFVNISYATPGNLVTATTTAGSHSYNKIYGNLVQNCHIGILFGGWTLVNTAFCDTDNDIGGLSAVTGNTVINYGGGGFNAAAAIYSWCNLHINVSYNYIDNNNGNGVDHPYTLKGITNWYTNHNANATILSNTISLKGAGTLQRVTGIEHVDASNSNSVITNTVTIANNLVTNCIYTTSTSGDLIPYWVSGPTSRILVDQNTATNISCTYPIACMYFNSGGYITVSSNTVSNVTSGTYLMGINCPNSPSLSISNNLFENMQAGWWLKGFMPGNAVSNFSATGNTLRNFSAVSQYLYGIHEIGTNANKVITNNTIHTFSAGAGATGPTVAAIYCTQGTVAVSGNTIHNLSSAGSNGTNTINVYGVRVTGGQLASIQKNKIYGLNCSSQLGFVCGISNSITALISNNTVGNFSCATCISPTTMAGIELNNGTNYLYHNSVYLNAASTVSLSGTTALFASTLATVDMRNNLLVNVSTPTGVAVTSAFRMNSFSLANLSLTCNNNLFYAGTPSFSTVIFAGSPVICPDLPNYKNLFNPRELFSVSELPPFASIVPSGNNYLSINTGSATQVESGGTPIAAVSDDIVNTIRNLGSPDIGAWEDNYLPLDITPPFLLNSGLTPTATCNLFSQTFTVNLLDVTGVAGGTLSPRVYYKVNNGAYSSVAGNLAAGSPTNGTWSFTLLYSVNPGDVISYFIVAQDTWSPFNLFASPSIGFTGTDINTVITPPSMPFTYTISVTPTITVNSATICLGDTFNIIPAGANSYTFSGGNAVVSPTITSTYSVTGTNTAGCVSAEPGTLTVVVLPLPVISVNSGSICAGNSFTILPSGANTYTISGGSAVVMPAVSSNYSVTGTSTAGCVSAGSAISSVTVNALPLPSVTINSGSICTGQTFTFVPSGASTYTFSNGSLTVSPLSNTSYSVTGTSTAGCVSSTVAVGTVSVFATPIVSVSSGGICLGQTFTLLPTGASTYTFSSGTDTVSPLSDTSYSVTGTSTAGCVSSNTAVASVTVFAVPLVSVNGGSLCSGQIFTLVPSGASTYTFSSGTDTVSPLSDTSYSVTGTSTAGCVSSNTAVASVTVFAVPLVSVNGGSLCSGQIFTLVPSGASTYTFSSGSATVNPTSNASYSVTGSSTAGCVSTNTAVATITVFASPVLSINSGSICAGQAFTLIPSGASTYTFTGGNYIITPTTTTSYTFTGSSPAGCISASMVVSSVSVYALPSLTVSSTPPVICAGETATLTASGASIYLWENSSAESELFVTPPATTVYTVTGTTTEGCASTSTITQLVDQCTGLVHPVSSQLRIKVYPNPSNGEFVIEAPENSEMLLMNSLGQSILSRQLQGIKIPFSIAHLANGIYFIRIKTSTGEQMVKIIRE